MPPSAFSMVPLKRPANEFGQLMMSLTMNSVVLEQVDQVVDIHEGVVDRGHLGVALGEGGAENKTADSTEAVDTHADGAHAEEVCDFNLINTPADIII
jgi:hypothetical protein